MIKTTGVDNTGHIGAINNLSLTSTQAIHNSGKILAGSVQLDAATVNNMGSIIQTGDQSFTIRATQLTNSGSIGIAEDTSNPPAVDPTTGQATSSNTETPATDTGNTSNPEVGTPPITTNPVVLKAGHITANNTLSNSGSITTSGALTVNASDAVNNSGAIRTAAPLTIQTQTLNNTTTGSIKSQNNANITATTAVHNQGNLQAQNLTITAPTIDNNQGNLTGEQVLNLNANGQITNVEGSIAGKALHLNTPQLDNTKGSISTSSDLTLDNAHLDNSTGSISAKNLILNNRTLANTDGQLLASEGLTSTADSIINSNGTIAAGTTLTVNASSNINNDKGLLQGKTTDITTTSLTNTNNLNTGGIIGQEILNVTTTGDINNQSGLIAGNTSVVNAAQINNIKGSLQSAKTLTVKTATLNNTEGNVSSQDKLTLTATRLINNNGNVATAANLALNVNQINNATGTIIANQNAQIQSDQLNNDAGGLIQANNLSITAAQLSNKDSGTTGGIIATKALDVMVSGNINNVKGYIGGGTATLQAAHLDNAQGQVNSNNGLNITAGALNNNGGILGSAATVSLSTVSLNNSKGNISSSQGNVNLKTNALINDGGQIIANASTALAAKTISNTIGLIQGKNLSIATGTLSNTQSGSTGGLIGIDRLNITTTDHLNNQAGYLAGQHVTVHTASMDNSSAGTISATGTLNLTSTGVLNNATGKITANGVTQINTSEVNNSNGTISSLADLTLTTGALSNTQGLIIGNQNTTLSATTVNNTKGLIQGHDLTLTATSLDNSDTAATGGVIATNALKVTTTADINNTNGYMGGTNATINGANINNSTGKVIATDLTLASSTINNAAGQISVSGNANITSGSLNNQNGLVYAKKDAHLNIVQIDNSNTIQDLSTATSPKGIQAQNLTIKGDTLNNSTGQIIGGNISTTSATSLNNQGGQILGGNLSVSAPSLSNLNGKLLADNALDLTTQNYTHQGQVQGNKKTALHLTGDFVNQGTLSSGGDLSIDTTGNITNSAGSTLSATRTLALNGQNITNGTDATIIANHTQLNAADTVTNNGTIDGALTELRAKAVINNHKIYGGTFDGTGGVLIGADTLTNNTNAVIASRAGMNIGAAQITNQPGGLIQIQGNLSVGRTLGTAAEEYAVTGIADRLDNNSATIEVGGDVKQWNVAETFNKNTQFATTAGGSSSTTNASYYVVNGQQTSTGNNSFVTYRNYNPLSPFVSNHLSYGDSITSSSSDLPNLPPVYSDNYGNAYIAYLNTLGSGNKLTGILVAEDLATIQLNKDNSQIIDYSNELVNNAKGITSFNYFSAFAEGVIGVQPPAYAKTTGETALDQTGFWSPYWYIEDSAYKQRVIDAYGWKSYDEINPVRTGLLHKEHQFVNLAYNPTRYAYVMYSYGGQGRDNDPSTGFLPSKLLIESFTYNNTDPIWSRFGVTPPTTSPVLYPGDKPNLPIVWVGTNSNGGEQVLRCDLNPNQTGCSTYNQDMVSYNAKLSTYTAWADQNRDKYIELNHKILAYNDDLNAKTALNYSAFEGTATSTAPVVTSSAPAKIIVAGNMALSGHITNDKSQIIVGGNLTGNVSGITNDNTGATAQVVTTYAGTMYDIQGGQVKSSVAANPTPAIQTINLSVAEVKTNAGAQAVASAAGNTSNGASNVTVAGQNTANTSTNTGGQANASTLSNSTQPADNNGNSSQTANIDGSPVTTLPTTDGKGIRTVAFNGILPSNALFSTSSDPALNYLIVTDPQFTNKKQFLSSDYMLNQFDADKKWQRIGDGFYEQKLINDQIITATGQRFIGDYSSNEAQYTALMNNGVAAGKAFGLSIGTALTAEQMGKLTTDIVWMVEQTVTLADGSTRRVLVPKVYLAVNTIDLKGDGTIIAAKNSFLNVTGDVTNNGGTIAAFNAMDMTARNINNNGGFIGGNKASDITLRTTADLNNIGGTIRGGNVDLQVGRNLNSITTTQTSSTGDMSNPLQRGYASTRTAIDQVASIQALDGNRTKTYTDEDGKEQTYVQNALNITAGDANFKGASTTSAGDTQIDANNINASTVDTGFAENVTYSWTGKNKRRSDRADTAEVGSNLTSTGDTTLIAKSDIRIHGSTVAADGDLSLLGDTVNIEAGRNTLSSRDETYTKKKGFLSSKSKHTINSNTADVSMGSTLIGNTNTVISTHDTNITGSTVFGTNGVGIGSLNGNVNIAAAEDRFNEQNYSKEKKSGFGALGGFSFGTMSNEQGRTGDTIGHTGSTIAALNGDVNIQATKGTASVSGSTVNTLNGNVGMLAKNIKIIDVQNTATEDSYTKFKSTGISVSINSPILDAVNSANTIADQAGKAQGGTQVGALAVSGGLAGVVAYKQLTNMGKDIAALGATPSVGKLLGALGSVSINLGTQKSESNSHSSESTSQGSSVTAGSGTVKLTATGAGTANDSKTALDQGSDILIQGSHVAGQTGTHLTADDDIIIKAGESTQTSHTSNKSSGGSIGVTIGGSGLTANAGINAAKGKTNGSGTTHTASTVGDAGSSTTFNSGGDTTLTGAQLIGQTVTGTVGGDLTMTSTQDTSRYTAKQTSASAGISVPLGAGAMSVSGSFSNDNTKANTETVNQVSGVFAGTGGYNLNVTGQTALTGAVIASTAASAKNSLTTGSLITEDLHNSSDYKASSMGLSASWSGHNSTKDGQAADKDGKAVTDGSAAYQSGYNGYNAGLPSVMNAKGSTDSTTHAGVSAGAVTITNEAAQQTATGQTAAQTIAGMNRDVSADPLNNTGVANLYEQNKDNITNGFAIVKTLGQNTNTFMAEMAKDLDKKGSEPAIGEDGKAIMVDVKDSNGNITLQPATIAQAVTAGLKPVGDTATSYISQNKAFGMGGYGSIMLTAIVGAASGNVTGSGSALLQNTAINVLRQYGAQNIKTIADGFRPAGATTDDALSGSIRAALHAIAGCAGAAATGGDCTSAAAGSAATVALNNLIGADTTKMNAEQKQAYSNLMGTLVAGVTAGVGGDAAAAQLAAKVEVENNRLLNNKELNLIAQKANGDKALEVRLIRAACYATKCWEQYPVGSPEREANYVSVLEGTTEEYAWVKTQLANGYFNYSTSNSLTDKAKSTVIPAVGNSVKVVTGGVSVAGGAALCGASGVGCIAGVPMGVWGSANVQEGSTGLYNQYQGNGAQGSNYVRDGLTNVFPQYGNTIYNGVDLVTSVGAPFVRVPMNVVNAGSLPAKSIFGATVPKFSNPIVIPKTNITLPYGTGQTITTYGVINKSNTTVNQWGKPSDKPCNSIMCR